MLPNPSKKDAAFNNLKKMMLDRQIFPINHQFISSRNATTLHLACQYGDPTTINRILQGGGSADATDTLGHTALHYACRMGNVEAAQALFEALGDDLDVDVKTNAGVTPLMLAIASRNDEMVALILE